MAKARSVWRCQTCGASAPRWQGRCSECGEYGTMVEEIDRQRRRFPAGCSRERDTAWARHGRVLRRRRACRPGSASSTACSAAGSSPARSSCSAARRASASRRCCSRRPRARHGAAPTRSTSAARSRRADPPARRAPARAPHARSMPLLAETDIDAVERRSCAEPSPDVCVVDSVQTLAATDLTGAPGTVGQVRECARAAHGRRQGPRDGDAARRPRDEGRRARRPARARAPGRLRAAVRGRARARLPHRARGEEPLRLDERVGVFEMREGGLVGVGRPRRALLVRARRRGARAASSWRRWRARARCSSRCRRSSRPSYLPAPRRVATGIEPQPPAARARRARAPRRPVVRRPGRLRERRRRRARQRAGGRPGARAGGRIGAQGRAGRRATSRRLRRARAHRRAALGRPPRARARGGRAVRADARSSAAAPRRSTRGCRDAGARATLGRRVAAYSASASLAATRPWSDTRVELWQNRSEWRTGGRG